MKFTGVILLLLVQSIYSCSDRTPDCAARKADCVDDPIILNDCRKTCGICPSPDTPACVDTLADDQCQTMTQFCVDPIYYPLMNKECPKTCGFCT